MFLTDFNNIFMSVIIFLLNSLLTAILAYDSLSLLYQIRKTKQCEENDFRRVCLSWVFFIGINRLIEILGCGLLGYIFYIPLNILKIIVKLQIID